MVFSRAKTSSWRPLGVLYASMVEDSMLPHALWALTFLLSAQHRMRLVSRTTQRPAHHAFAVPIYPAIYFLHRGPSLGYTNSRRLEYFGEVGRGPRTYRCIIFTTLRPKLCLFICARETPIPGARGNQPRLVPQRLTRVVTSPWSTQVEASPCTFRLVGLDGTPRRICCLLPYMPFSAIPLLINFKW